MPSASFFRLASETVATKRGPAMIGGKKGEPELHLTGLKCTPLDPVSEQTANRYRLLTPHTVRECFAEDTPDVIAGDVLVLDDRDYPISYVERRKWPTDNTYYLHLVVEALKR